MPILRAMRLFNAIEANEFTAATLEALLADAGRRNDLDAVTADRALMHRLAQTPAAAAVVLGSARGRASVFASTVAMEALCASRLGRDAVFNTPAVLAALVASPVGMGTLGESVICKMQLSVSTPALTAVAGSATALTALRGCSQYRVVAVGYGYGTTVPFTMPGERYIMLGVSQNIAQNTTVTMQTILASGSGATTIINSSDNTGTSATTKAAAVTLQAPYSATRNSGSTTYHGLLRCDI